MSSVHVLESQNEIPKFLEFLFEGLSGFVYSPTIDRELKDSGAESKDYFRQHWFKWPEQQQNLQEHISKYGETLEVYLAPAIFSQQSPKKEAFAETNVVWTEFDGNYAPTKLIGPVPEPSLVIQSSIPGFAHVYWRLDEPCNDVSLVEGINRQLAYGLGADSSAWDATQILRPPSTRNHKRNAEVRILDQNNSRVTGTLFSANLPAVPEPKNPLENQEIPDSLDVVLKYSWPSDAAKLYKARDIPVGNRSSALMRLGYFLAEMGLSDAEMFSVLRNADDRWGKFKGRPDRDKRLTDLIAKARIKYPESTDVSVDEDVIPVFGFQTLLNVEIELSWVIPQLLQEQGYLLLTGPSGIGKTQVTLRFAMQMALGRSYLGLEITRPFRLAFFSCEMDLPDLKYFLSTMADDLPPEDLAKLEQNLLLVPLGEPFLLDNEAGQKKFKKMLSDLDVEGFFFDSVGSATSGELSSETTVKTLMNFNDSLRKETGVFSWFIHHHRKATSDNKKPKKLDDVYGNQYLVNRATTVYCLWPAGGLIEVIPLKKRLAAKEEPWFIQRMPNLDFVRKENVNFGKLTAVEDSIMNEVTGQSDTSGPELGSM